ncbi:MAG: aminotransferase class I/II-fold pyridoxal phosphate-dependent enzyme [Planctomycetes bacterium]|nr:aminotransferase class I/II-fold pyridoxal phosphate-dependent enzyme [Planctomycetota bacterium]
MQPSKPADEIRRGRFLSQKASRFGESVIRGMTRLCNQHGGINLSQGFPGTDPPPEVLEAAHQALRGGYHQYSITWGSPRLRQAVAEKVKRYNGIAADPETMITITCGATEAMVASLLAVIDPGDEVVVFEPFYENYGPGAIISGGRPRFVPLRAPDFQWKPHELEAAFGPGTRAVILNTPHNPTGKVFSRRELETIAELCRRWDCLAITDEIYEHILYGEREHVSIAVLPGMAERTITIGGLSKTYAITGWRLAYAIAVPELSLGIRKMHDFLTVGAPAPLQEAGVTALRLPPEYYQHLKLDYSRKRGILLDYLERAGFNPLPPEGSYFILCDIGGIAQRWGVKDDAAFAEKLVADFGVAGVPGSSFYSDPGLGRHLIRFHFAAKDEVLHQAGERLLRAGRA